MDTCKNGHLLTPENTSPNGKGGKWVCCKLCKNARAREYAQNHWKENKQRLRDWCVSNPTQVKTSAKKRKLKMKYGLTPERVQEMVVEQGGKCAACGSTEPGGRHNVWLIDHNHMTGKVRGLLCNGCNVALGMLKEDETRIFALIEYLRRYKENTCSDEATGQFLE